MVSARRTSGLGWARWGALAWFTAGLSTMLVVMLAAGCRRGVPVIDTGPKPPQAAGTISGTVRGPERAADLEGRVVEVVNIETSERQQATTNSAGGFTFKVKPGKYRVELTLRDGETLVKQPGIMTVNESDVDAHADFVIGPGGTSRPRGAGSRNSPELGSPIAGNSQPPTPNSRTEPIETTG